MNLQKFALALQSLFGEGSETIMNLIYRNLCRQLEVKAELDPAMNGSTKFLKQER